MFNFPLAFHYRIVDVLFVFLLQSSNISSQHAVLLSYLLYFISQCLHLGVCDRVGLLLRIKLVFEHSKLFHVGSHLCEHAISNK